MSVINDFEKQWNNFIQTIESKIIRSYNDFNKVDIDDVNQSIQGYFRNWEYASSYEGIWFKKIKNADMKNAEKLLEKAKTIKLQNINKALPSRIPYYILSVLLGIVVFAVLKYAGWESWKLYGIPFVSIVAAFSILSPIAADRIDKEKKNMVKLYKEQLESHKPELSAICNEIDRKVN
jgi:hypothetical protein